MLYLCDIEDVTSLFASGIGPEIGLEEGVQQIWDPTPKRHVYVNHVTQEVSWIDPRPSKPTLPTITPRVSQSTLMLLVANLANANDVKILKND